MIVSPDVYLTLFGVDAIDPIAARLLAKDNPLVFRAEAATRFLRHAPKSKYQPGAVRVIVEFFKEGLSDRNALLCSDIFWTVAANQLIDAAPELAPFAAKLAESSEESVRAAARAFLEWHRANVDESNP